MSICILYGAPTLYTCNRDFPFPEGSFFAIQTLQDLHPTHPVYKLPSKIAFEFYQSFINSKMISRIMNLLYNLSYPSLGYNNLGNILP